MLENVFKTLVKKTFSKFIFIIRLCCKKRFHKCARHQQEPPHGLVQKWRRKKHKVSSLLCELPTAMRNLTFVAILYIPYIIWLANQ